VAVPRFRPRYIFENELSDYGLPGISDQASIMALVNSASKFIDEYCGVQDGNGQGSLVWTTYIERLVMQARNRNIVRTMHRPMSVVTDDDVASLTALATASGSAQNNYWTGVQSNTITRPDGTLTAIIGASGRYGYPRRGEAAVYPDLNYGLNLLQVAAFFGGPPGFMTIDASAIDWVSDLAELWVPAGLYMSQYTELLVIYNSGYDPRNMPEAIKQACAALVRNYLAKGGVTGLRGISGQGMVNVTFTDDLVDPVIERFLSAYKHIIAM
jgi:hypothetical protein